MFVFDWAALEDRSPDCNDHCTIGLPARFGYARESGAGLEELDHQDKLHGQNPHSRGLECTCSQQDDLGCPSHNPVWAVFVLEDAAAESCKGGL